LLINGRSIARGEVVVIDEQFGLRITEVVSKGRPDAGAPVGELVSIDGPAPDLAIAPAPADATASPDEIAAIFAQGEQSADAA